MHRRKGSDCNVGEAPTDMCGAGMWGSYAVAKLRWQLLWCVTSALSISVCVPTSRPRCISSMRRKGSDCNVGEVPIDMCGAGMWGSYAGAVLPGFLVTR